MLVCKLRVQLNHNGLTQRMINVWGVVDEDLGEDLGGPDQVAELCRKGSRSVGGSGQNGVKVPSSYHPRVLAGVSVVVLFETAAIPHMFRQCPTSSP